MKKGNMGFKYERKRIKRDKKLPPLCQDYEPGSIGSCKKAPVCKNASNSIDGVEYGFCYGGTKSSEREDREKRFAKVG
ncbi:MAG: hypothetical protein ABIA67_03260 [Candidatus Margulisiibacteriota bacterium]